MNERVSPSLVEALTGIVDAAMELSAADFGNIQLLGDDGRLHVVAHRKFPDWWLDYWELAPQEQGSCGLAFSNQGRVIVEDIEESPVFVGTPSLEIQRRIGLRGVQSTPFFARSGALLGMLSTHYRKPYFPATKELKVLDFMAAHAAALIEHDWAEQALKVNEEQLRRATTERPTLAS